MGLESPKRGVGREKSLDIDDVFAQKYMGGKDMNKSRSSTSLDNSVRKDGEPSDVDGNGRPRSRRRGRRPSMTKATPVKPVENLMNSFDDRSDEDDEALLLDNTNHNTGSGRQRHSRRGTRSIDISGEKEGSRRGSRSIDKNAERSRRGRRSVDPSPKRERSRRGGRSIDVDKVPSEKSKGRKEGRSNRARSSSPGATEPPKSPSKSTRSRSFSPTASPTRKGRRGGRRHVSPHRGHRHGKHSPRTQNEADQSYIDNNASADIAVMQFDPTTLVPAQADKSDPSSDEESQRQSYLTGVAQFAPGPVDGQNSMPSPHSDDEFTDNTEASGRNRRRKKKSSRGKDHGGMSHSMPDLDFETEEAKRKGRRKISSRQTNGKVPAPFHAIQHHSSGELELSSDEEAEPERVGESFARRRNRRRSKATKERRQSDTPGLAIQFQPPERRPSLAGNIGHTPYDDMISELETETEVETDRDDDMSMRSRVKLFNADDFESFANLPAAQGRNHLRVGAEFEKVKSAVICMEESDAEKSKAKKGKGLMNIGRYFGRNNKKGKDGGGGESDHESVSSRGSRLFRGPMKHSLLLDQDSSASDDSHQF